MRFPIVSLRVLLVCLVAASAPAAIHAQAVSGPAIASPANVGPDDREAIARSNFRAEDVGYVLFDLDSGAPVAARQADRPFAPASVAKLPAMAAALAILGPEHRFETSLHVTGTLRDGVLDGDLVLKGGGDPSLATEGLMELAAELRAMGIARIAGRFLFDASALPELPEIDSGQPWTAGYNTGVGALSVNFNRFQLSWTARAGQPVQASAWSVSDAGRVPLDSVAVEIAAGEALTVTPVSTKGVSAREGERWRLAPRPGAASSVWLPVTHPGLAAAHVFRRVAADTGVALPAPVPGTAPPSATLAALHRSEPLGVLARQVLRYSNNLSAELIGLAAARRLDPRVATLAQSAAVLSALPMAALPRTDWTGWRLLNHSGLTTASRVTPAQMAAVLRAAGPEVWDLLPGEDEGKVLPRGVHAKSGTLAYAKALAGTLTTAGGRRLGFAFFVTDEGLRRAMDAAMDRRVAEIPPEARAWLARARTLQADLLALWIAQL
ncbi:D-alanyl-D-alanine carboxypeptidase/D-alanyl-D-alanine endopeptidase [Azospirillum rugosum]|uniref:D-alanyl-D-alanine carboxypeptidase/D-alanyl-D-alanine-endopeptidase (Penicillin-binding protein 4) n=1 Tax=Azospirillum rugosum TaxID=416170 RepID=A0ABS4SUU8_9PROT|nr:D-alanyl-D-alanine carboxypeptidase/D-alanyl-D-alanine-endopeptidase [Azospirillum rugosum]MBP2296353.1 D-alanyl-D-alanine carboxypeptidase/D-alanyl-D-alanine-endopeptidase (penicillin-binding protein 4) [Azospirillum rugosum]MDQ0529874.1 D-alanyl-D-alanine carboxypeptidase/D-alanyl-D-alanine-endopeptidase (penicillin-binding protein 4) [Azospirillum rugosum]